MARRLTDTYFVKYSMVVVRMHINSEDREDEVVESIHHIGWFFQ